MPQTAVHSPEVPELPQLVLDGVALEPAWVAPTRRALQQLALALPPQDLAILNQLRGHVASTLLPSDAVTGSRLAIHEGTQKRLPVTVTLLNWNDHRPGPAMTCLTAILVNAALGPEGRDTEQRRHIVDLARMVRNANELPNAALRALLAGADSVTGILLHLEDDFDASPNQLHVSFSRLWVSWLRHRVARWILAEPGQLAQALGEPPNLLTDITAPNLPAWGNGDSDADDQVEVVNAEVGGKDFEGLGWRSTHALAIAHQLLRKSGDAGLVLHPDQLVPEGLIKIVARSALKSGQAAIKAGQGAGAEPLLALGFAIACGLRDIDLQAVVWGTAADEGDLILRIEAPVVMLRLKRPPNAVVPLPHLLPFLEPTTDVIRWPLPPSLHTAIKELVSDAAPVRGSSVFPGKVGGLGGGYNLRDSIPPLLPGAYLGAGQFRLALASHLSERFGPEVAQLVMRDSFSTTLGPAYYGSLPERSIMAFVSQLLSRWFGEQTPLNSVSDERMGSRLVLKDDAAKQWPTRLAKEAYSAARRKNSWRGQLIAERDHLAGAFCAATASRPGKSIGDLMLDSVIPEYGLVVLEDKLADLLRRTRVAATGRRWVTALREYLDRLIELSKSEDGAVSGWAIGVLKSEQPLFSTPSMDGGFERLDMETMRAMMPDQLKETSNHYRHRLNQRLQGMDIDWELRHGQLGWVVSPSFALADLSPLSPRSFGDRLGHAIDALMVEDGWYTQRQRTPKWSWDGVPDRPLKDWATALSEYEKEHDVHVREVRESFKARRKEVEALVLPRVARAIAEFIPALRLEDGHRVLKFAPGFKSDGPVALAMEHYALIQNRVRKDDDDPTSALEALAAEYLIHELITRGIKDRIIAGPEPRRRHLGVTANLSPFMPGIGLAVRHAEAIRFQLGEVAAKNEAHDMAGVVQLSTLANTPYRDFNAASSAVGAASQGARSASNSQWLWVPARQDRREEPMVFAGVGAAALARRGNAAPTARPLSRDEFGQWMQKRFNSVVACEEGDVELVSKVVDTLRIAGRLELSGPERLVMEGHPLATVGISRALGIADGWPLRTSSAQDEFSDELVEVREPASASGDKAARSNRKDYLALTATLNPDVSRRSAQNESDGKRGWRGKVGKALDAHAKEVGVTSNLGLIIEYITHRLRHGGRGNKKLSQGNLHKEVTRFAGRLLDVLGKRDLAQLEDGDLQAVYMAVLSSKTRSVRTDVLEELVRFHRHLRTVHHLPEVDFAPLRAFAGPRIRSSDAGALSDEEVRQTILELLRDLESELARQDASPDNVRACGLRLLLFLVLEASGLRPGSAYGFVLGDFHLLGPGHDYVHVHRTGEYGEAKTTTSVGFVRLEGKFWKENRQWVLDWIDKEKKLLGDGWWKIPTFAEKPGSRRRFASRYLTRRIDQLLKWVSDQKKARTYWLRKRRMTARIGDAMRQPEPTARAVYRALRESGQTDILTPLLHYIHDLTVPLATYLAHADVPNRAAVLGMTALPASPLDAIWHRNRQAGNEEFHSVVLDRIGVPVSVAAEERLTDPPSMHRQKPLTPRHIDIFARAMHRHGDRRNAMVESGLSDTQVEFLEQKIAELVIKNGSAPWWIHGIKQDRVVIPPARMLKGTETLFEILDQPTEAWMITLCEAWTHQPFVQRLHGESVVLVLDSEELHLAAQKMLTKTGINLVLIQNDAGSNFLSEIEISDGEKSSHRNSLRWVFAMCWLCQELTTKS